MLHIVRFSTLKIFWHPKMFSKQNKEQWTQQRFKETVIQSQYFSPYIAHVLSSSHIILSHTVLMYILTYLLSRKINQSILTNHNTFVKNTSKTGEVSTVCKGCYCSLCCSNILYITSVLSLYEFFELNKHFVSKRGNIYVYEILL